MTLEDLGYNATIDDYIQNNALEGFEIGRIIAEHKERYVVKNLAGEFEAEITGNLRFTAKNRADFPAVGDWVTFLSYEGSMAIIHGIIPRTSTLSRQAVGKFGESQIMATNIDFAFLVQAADRDFNINRLERYLTICNASNVNPIIVLTKTDLIDSQTRNEMVEKIKQRIEHIPIVTISNETKDGYNNLKNLIQKGKTYCLLGSSGVGKSTLTNNLAEKDLMKTNAISKSTNKGRHITSHRELTVLKNGGILIDNPGMREIGVIDTADGLMHTFDKIFDIAKQCKFRDCSHTNEKGCAVLEAIDTGEIDQNSYDNFLKIEKEKEHFDLTVAEKRKKEKSFGKMIKHVKKDMQNLNPKHRKK